MGGEATAPQESTENAPEKTAAAKDGTIGVSPEEIQDPVDVEDVSDFPPLFDDEGGKMTEAQLSGEEPAKEAEETPGAKKEETATPESKGEEGEEAGKEKEASNKEDGKGEDDKADAESDEKSAKAPPPGFVPKEALHEERELRKKADDRYHQIEEKYSQLEREVAGLKDGKTARDSKPVVSDRMSKWKDFEVLSKDDYNELAEDDPPAAAKYLYDLREYERDKEATDREQERVERTTREASEIVSREVKKVQEAIPELYDKGSSKNQELTKFATDDFGLDPEFLAAMTSPDTLVLPAGAEEPMLLSKGASSLILAINKAYKNKAESDPEALKGNIRKEIEADIRKDERDKVTKELMDKFKSGGADRNIANLRGSEDAPHSGHLSETDYAKMSPEERERALGG